MGPLYGDAMEERARAARHRWGTRHSLHDCVSRLRQMGRRWVALAGVRGQWGASRGRETARPPRAPWRRDQHRRQKRDDGIAYSGHKHQKGDKVIAITDNNGYVLAPLPVAPVHETDMVLLPKGLQALQQ